MDTRIPEFYNACEILGIPEEDQYDIDEEMVKKQYRKCALLYHPDKNSNKDTAAKFVDIQNAYEFLIHELNSSEEEADGPFVGGYRHYLFLFFKPILQRFAFDETQQDVFYSLLEKIATNCEEKAISMIKKIDISLLRIIYGLIRDNQEILHCSSDLMSTIEHVLSEKKKEDECILLHPRLEDIVNNNVYKLVHGNNIYWIPLWHNELVYDNSGNDLYVKCVPDLQAGVLIDEKNNLHIDVCLQLSDVADNEKIRVEVSNCAFVFDRQLLMLQKHQIVVLRGQGISKINSQNIYDITRRGKLILNIDLDFLQV